MKGFMVRYEHTKRYGLTAPIRPAAPPQTCGYTRRPEPPSSRGLGRRPLTAETGVRIPVAVLEEASRERGFRRSRWRPARSPFGRSGLGGGHAIETQRKVMVVMPAFRAEATLRDTFEAIPPGSYEHILLVDDCSDDRTVAVAEELGIPTISHEANRGYGANQKTCYEAALATDAEIVVMLHPDNQYDPRLVPVMAEIIDLGICDMVMGSRIRSRRQVLAGGMPRWKYFTNRATTLAENFLLGTALGDLHSGYRAYPPEVPH